MPDPVVILQALAAAVLSAAAVVLVCALVRRNRPKWAAASMVLGAGLGFVAGCGLLGVRPNWPPREDQDRLLLILFPAVLVIELLQTALGKWTWLLRFALAASTAWVLLFGSVYLTDVAGPGSREWTPAQTWVILGALATALTVVWAALATLAQRAGGRSVPLALSLACAGAGVTVMLSGYASGGQLGLPLATSVAGVMLASLVLYRPLDTTGVTGAATVGLFSVLIIGRFFGELTTNHAIIFFLAPLACWLTELPLIRRLSPRLRGLVRVELVMIPVVLVILSLVLHKPVGATGNLEGTQEPSMEDYMNFGK
jgi:hypothetical protein